VHPCRCCSLATLITLSILMLTAAQAQEKLPYRNSALSIEQRVTDLVSRMTLEEKVAQLGGTWQNRDIEHDETLFFVGKNRELLPDRAAVLLKDGLGGMSRPSENRGPREMAEFTNTVQKWIAEHTRLGIPVLFHDECLHGHVAPQGTSYPQAIALASTWDTSLVQNVFSATALEVRARGVQQCLAPVVDLARDPRWGRTEETYGEDPYLTSRIGVAAVRGFQGDGPMIDQSHVMATMKHFAVHSQPESGTNVGPGNYSEHVVREYFLKPFQAAILEAHAASLMPSYNELDGIPNHSNRHLLNDVLRQEWGFQGLVVSDYFAVHDLNILHHVVANDEQAAKMALESGVDMELPAVATYRTLIQQVRGGKVSESYVNRAVARVLRAKFLAGLFENPYVDPARAEKVTNTPEHQQLALDAAHESIILLKNENNLLPLNRSKYKRIAIIGPNAADLHLGGYSNQPGRGVSVLQGIKDKVGSDVEVLYAEGCKITETVPDWNADKVILGDPVLNAKRIQGALPVARKADLIILVLGENEQTSREAWAANHLGDRDSLDLLGSQDELAKAMVETGKPIVVVLLHGRPNSVNYIAEKIPAIIDGWYLGQEGGRAMADVLFGDYNPAGRLPITVPRNVGQLPDYYYQKPSARRGYLGSSTTPLFPFGWGLSYTTFTYSGLRLAPATIGIAGETKVSVDVTNTGKVRGDEVVQLYIRDEVSSVTRPIKELRGFRRITLEPGERKTVDFTLGFDELSFFNRDMLPVVEPGTFKIMVGGNSVDLVETTLTAIAK
jgi:beta-glucosidase-like glycosyl hydrolase